MTNTLSKIMHDGDEYLFPEGFTPESAGTTGQVLKKTATGYDWENGGGGGGDVIVSPDADNELSIGAGIWAGDRTNLPATPDSNTLYFGY